MKNKFYSKFQTRLRISYLSCFDNVFFLFQVRTRTQDEVKVDKFLRWVIMKIGVPIKS